MPSEIVTTKTAQIWLAADGIIRCVSLRHANLDLPSAMENDAVMRRLCGGRPRPLLTDPRVGGTMDAEARHHYAHFEDPAFVPAIGILIRSGLQKVIGSFFLNLKRSKVPVRLFNDEAEAVAWLKAYRAPATFQVNGNLR